ncbi:MAG: ABC transporter substrate-binding protein [Nitrososphaerota archaeon]
MKEKFLRLRIFLVIILFLCAVSSSAFVQAKSKEPYVIGGIFPLTGYLSWLGEYKKKGAELQVEIINETGGVDGTPLKLVIYDDQSSPEQAVRVAERLIIKDKVVALIGTASVPISGAVASIANKYGIPTIIGSGYEINPQKDKFIFNTAHKTDFAVARPFEYFKSLKITKIGLLMPIGSLGELGSRLARQYAPIYGLTVIGEEKFDVKAPDVTAQLAKLRVQGPDAIFSFSTGEPAALVARNMAQLGLTVPLLVSHGNATPGFLNMVKGINVPILVPSGRATVPEELPDTDPCKKVIMEFSKKHEKKYGEPANYYSAEMADAIAILAEAIKRAKSIDGEKLRVTIENIRNFVGMQGIYNFSENDHHGTSISDMLVLTVKDGQWKIVWR